MSVDNLNKKYSGAVIVYLGMLDCPDTGVPSMNVWCESQLSWADGIAGIKQLAQGVENRDT